MKTEKNILIAFLLNFFFALFEMAGGLVTGSIAILGDAFHDMGDAVCVFVSYCLEKKSKKQPDEQYTYGYGRYSVLGSVITTMVLLIGSFGVIWGAVGRIQNPVAINYDGMLLLAAVGITVNFFAARFTHGGHSANQKSVNLHMLEDLLGWVAVLMGAVVMRFTHWTILDPILSIGVAMFIMIHALKHLKENLSVFLEKTPKGINGKEITDSLCTIQGVKGIHHLHFWSVDGNGVYATLHVVGDGGFKEMKKQIREKLREYGIVHVTLETEKEGEVCQEMKCSLREKTCHHGHHHH